LGNGLPLANFTLAQLTEKYSPQVLDRRMVGSDQRITLRMNDIKQTLQGEF
jgi:diaminohydroxyphosphoribosylaminopyrimidine deaminase / 5-amino-6-(5-phosphoribosylamino)uracil reductase